MIRDLYGRSVTSLRVSLTQRCNLHCFYCHREGELDERDVEMTAAEIERIVRVVAAFNIRKVKLTGGEPLLRNDIVEIVRRIRSIPKVSEISMTTNGTLLSGVARHLKEAGLSRVNVSLDTLKPETYRSITGVDALENVLAGIQEAWVSGLRPIKVNMVLLRGVNDDEVWSMIEFTRKRSLILQLIELESASEDTFYRRYHHDLAEIENRLKRKAKKIVIRRMHHRRRYSLADDAEIEIVKPMHNIEFCRYCSRMRVTSDGQFKPCLLRCDNHVDFLSPLRDQASNTHLADLFIKAVKRRKPYFS
jgi:cyclic pyranopterin phosphate synthase